MPSKIVKSSNQWEIKTNREVEMNESETRIIVGLFQLIQGWHKIKIRKLNGTKYTYLQINNP